MPLYPHWCWTDRHLPTDRELEPLLERTRSLAGTIPEQGSIRPPRVKRQQLRLPAEYVTPCGPPDISCADIPEEQLSRTYSRSCIWDPKTNPVPPIQEMEGFGRFRRSVHADANWELNQFRGDLQRLGPAAVQHLGEFEIARLKNGVMNNIRTPSCTSLHSRSDSGESSTCPRIYRGFTPSRMSSATKSSKDRSSSISRDGSRTTSPDLNDGTSGQLRPQSKRTSFLRFDAGPAPLATIDETADIWQKKKSVPLIFNAKGTTDAVIDDDDYETCEDSFAPAEVPAKAVTQDTPTAVSNWHEKKSQMPQIVLPTRNRGIRHNRTFDHAPEKARVGQKKSSKPVARRLSSRGSKALANRVTSKEDILPPVETKTPASSKNPTSPTNSMLPFAVSSPRAPPTSSEESVEGIPADPGLYMTNSNAPTTPPSENNDIPRRSNSTNQVARPDVRHTSHLTKAARGRDRSNTAIRVHSGNIPIIYLEGEVKHLLDRCEVDRNNLQPMAV